MVFSFISPSESVSYAPDHDALNALAASQAGYFTTAQARECGFSNQLIHSHLNTGNFERVQRGIYRLKVIPHGDNGDLVIHWLWSRTKGIFSHQTALSLLHLSDVLPARTHMTLPAALEPTLNRKTPTGLVLHFANIGDSDRQWFGTVPITTPYRAIRDCMKAGESDEILNQAIDESEERGLITRKQAQYTRALLIIRSHRDP